MKHLRSNLFCLLLSIISFHAYGQYCDKNLKEGLIVSDSLSAIFYSIEAPQNVKTINDILSINFKQGLYVDQQSLIQRFDTIKKNAIKILLERNENINDSKNEYLYFLPVRISYDYETIKYKNYKPEKLKSIYKISNGKIVLKFSDEFICVSKMQLLN